jgi:hypothetical protein
MTDEVIAQNGGRKPGLIRRIIWWIWVVLLSVLLALGLFFAVPWKIITLIIIFLLAATILPRAFRKWFWLGVGIVIIALVVWIFLPEDNKDWRPYTFDKEFVELQNKYSVPDSENAAIVYNQILANWKLKEANEPNLPDEWYTFAKKGPWLSKDHPEMAAYLWYHRNTIDGTLKASRFDKCSFPIDATSEDFGKDVERLSAIRQWAYLLVAAGNNDLAEGNTEEAIEKFTSVIRMGQHLSHQPRSVDTLVGIAIEALGLSGINNFIIKGDAKDAYLNQSEQTVSEIKHDWNSDLPGFVDTEKLMLLNQFGSSLYEVNSKGKVRLSRDPSAKIREELKKQLAEGTIDDIETKAELQKAVICPGYWQKKLMKTYTILSWFFVPASPEKLNEIVDESFETLYLMTKADFDWSKQPNEVPIESLFQFKLNFRQLAEMLAKMNEKTYSDLHGIYLKNLAMQRGTLLIIALRQYKNANGQWPEQLENIKKTAPEEIFVDPLNGNSFVYKRTEDNFILYSKGKNGIDEGGEQKTKFSDDYRKIEIIKDDVKIWLPKSPEGKQKNDDKNLQIPATDTIS